jgi:hypothetical protein
MNPETVEHLQILKYAYRNDRLDLTENYFSHLEDVENSTDGFLAPVELD